MEERALSLPAKLDAPGLFQSLFMRMAEGVALYQITFDRAGRPASYRFVDVNPQYERFLGLPRERLVGKLADEVYEDAKPRHLEVYAKVALEGVPARLETYCASLDRHYDVSVAPMGTGFFATILIDVTERRHQERKLLEGEWFLERSQIVGRLGSYRFHAASGTWVSSRGLDDVFGIAGDDGVTKDVNGWLSLVHPDDRTEMGRYMAEDVLGKGKAFDRRYRIVRRHDGQVRWMHGRGELEKDADGRVLYMIGTIQDITESVEQEQALRSKSEELDRIFSLTLDMLCIASADGRLLRVNAAWARVLGWSVAELEGLQFSTLCHPDDLAAANNAMKELASGKDLIDFTNRCRCKDGSYRFIEWRSVPAGGVIYAAARDVSERQRSQAERQRLEQQLLQSQKMESVGLLAGGVAHDFNNLLTVILGCTDEVLRQLGPESEAQALLLDVGQAAQRAAELTRQLLAFSRRQVLQPRSLDLNAVVAGVSRMLRRMLGENIKLEIVTGRDVRAVFADPGQLEQIIVNLAVNARDAMPSGGTLTFETANVSLAETASAECLELSPGAYVMLIVRDTGLGMDEATRARVFEPFFTTKGETGTGLGLATVYGIVKQSGGQIVVSSNPGAGATFKVYLPRASTETLGLGSVSIVPPSSGGHETVLLVEDEALVRTVLKRILVGAGYHVLEAANAEEATLLSDQFEGTIHVLITDVVMPGKTGPELGDQLLLVRPSLRVLYMSGYAPNTALFTAGLDHAGFIQKPMTPPQLLAKLREILSPQTLDQLPS